VVAFLAPVGQMSSVKSEINPVEEKMEKVIKLRFEDGQVISDWWTPEVKELFCALCKEESQDKDCESCLTTNPWCG